MVIKYLASVFLVLMMIGEIYQQLHDKLIQFTQTKMADGQEHQEMLKAYD